MFNQMKRKMFFRLTVVFMAAVSALIACTQDYSADITELQNQIEVLQAQVDNLQAAINNGEVITDVKQIDNGVRVTLSDGSHFDVTNGADGKPGDSWTIGTNGNWFKNGVDSGMPSQGAKGDKGDKGDTGATGPQGPAGADGASGAAGATGPQGPQGPVGPQGPAGADGVDGVYYYPCTDQADPNYGKWIKVDGDTETPTDDEWLTENTLTSVLDEDTGKLSFHDADGNVVEIALATDLKSIALIPEYWDGNLGMPTAEVFAILPSAWEIYCVVNRRDAVNLFRNGGVAWVDQAGTRWSAPTGWGLYYFTILYSTYLGKTRQTGLPGYQAIFDLSSPSFTYGWILSAIHEDNAYEDTFETFVRAWDDYMELWKKALDNVRLYAQDGAGTRQFPVSTLNLKYRVNPAGADMDDYKFSMIDRSLKVITKADGDNRNHAVGKVEAEYNGKDQLNVAAYIDYFRYWADKPMEWWFGLFQTREIFYWDYLTRFDGQTDDLSTSFSHPAFALDDGAYGNNLGRLLRLFDTNLTPASSYQTMNSANYWMDAMGLSYETIVALEAAKSSAGAQAVVSDYASVQMKYVMPVWTAYNYHEPDRPMERWMTTVNIWNGYKGGCNWENDLLKIGEEYDVAAHMRFADPYYGSLEHLGFKVKYDYYVFCAATGKPHTRYDATGFGDPDDDPYGSWAIDLGAWDKVTCTEDGKVKVKDGVTLASVLNQPVVITADASIYNEATGTWYNSSVGGQGMEPWGQAYQFDQYAAQYVLKIAAGDAGTETLNFDLGSYDYLALPKAATIATDDILAAAGVEDWAGFTALYNDPASVAAPAGVVTTIAGATGKINFDLGTTTPIAENQTITFTFAPKETGMKSIKVVAKFTVTNDEVPAELIPTINPDYILEGTENTVVVKGKNIAGVWTPQSSIVEHIYLYDSFDQNEIANTPQVDYMTMKLASGETGAEIFSTVGGANNYIYQEIKLNGAYAGDEDYRDVNVDIYLHLANGQEQKVDSYVVRFVKPFYMKATSITLETHLTEWCVASGNYSIHEVGTDKLLNYYSTGVSAVTTYARNAYVGLFETAEAPVWKSNADESFGDRLLYFPNNGLFYWNNLGTELQKRKTTTYTVTVVIPGLMTLMKEAQITILPNSESHGSHTDHADSTVEPAAGASTTVSYVFE